MLFKTNTETKAKSKTILKQSTKEEGCVYVGGAEEGLHGVKHFNY